MENKLIDDCMKLGFGMMRLPRVEGTIATPHSDQRLENDIDLEHTKRMVDAFIEAGGKYFDTAYIYEGSEEATKAAASLPNVMVVLSGMSSMEQMEDNVSFMQKFQPLTDEEHCLLAEVADTLE